MLDIRDLEMALAVVETGSMRAASEKVFLSQPAISRRIAALEAQYKVKLFARTARRLHLTDAGEEFIRRSREILGRVEDLQLEMGAFGRGQRGVLRIGATATVCRYLLAPVLGEMRRQHPEYDLFLSNESSRRMPELVREGAVDVGIASVAGRLPGLHIREWTRLHLGLLRLTPCGSDLVSIRELDGAPFVISSSGSLRSAVESTLRAHGVQPRIAAEADSLEVVRMLVGCGFGSAMVPREVMEEDARTEGLSLKSFVEEVEPLPVACFFRRTPGPVKAFLGLLPAESPS